MLEDNSKGIKVWDLFIRFFHWTLVASFAVSYLTEGEYGAHFYSGWYIGILLFLRIVWGIVGTKYSRFTDFIKPPSDILNYLKSLLSNETQEKTYLGHNPLGGLMVIVMLVSLSGTVFSGVMLYKAEGNATFDFIASPAFQEIDDDDEYDDEISHEKSEHSKESLSNKYDDYEEDELWEEIHEFFSNFSLLLILIHIFGVAFSSLRENRNLVKSMITGKK